MTDALLVVLVVGAVGIALAVDVGFLLTLDDAEEAMSDWPGLSEQPKPDEIVPEGLRTYMASSRTWSAVNDKKEPPKNTSEARPA